MERDKQLLQIRGARLLYIKAQVLQVGVDFQIQIICAIQKGKEEFWMRVKVSLVELLDR